MTVQNFLLWCLQIGAVAIIGGLLPQWLRVPAKMRLAYLHAVLVVCVLLPWIQPYRSPEITAKSTVMITSSGFVIRENTASAAWTPTWQQAGLILLAAGMLVRLGLLGIGVLRLRSLVRGAKPIAAPDNPLGPVASFYMSDEVRGPVTFGVRNPVVLLPPDFLTLASHEQGPVVCHELLHVERRDWAFAIAEEVVRAALWFHPAIWWLIERIQLTREEVVDQAVVSLTESKDNYVTALLSMARAQIEPDLAPAPTFLKRHHLRQRVAAIVEGVPMSARRILISTCAVFSALPLIVGIAAWQFPLQASPQEDAPGIEVRTGSASVLHRPGVAYPGEAIAKNISGEVVLAVSLSADGEVTDARVVSGPEALRKSALQSVLEWHFATDSGKGPFQVAIRYGTPPGTAGFKKPSATGSGKAYPLAKLDFSMLPERLQNRLANMNLLQAGQMVGPEELRQLEETVAAVDSHLHPVMSLAGDKVIVTLMLSGTRPVSAPLLAAPGQIRVGGNVQSTKLITKVTPIYPPEAKAIRLQGTVRFTVTIDKEGHVSKIDLVSGHPILVDSAMAAVRQWVYQTTLLNGNPVEVMTTVDVNYTLTE